jgi:hypothetical protein
MKRLILLVGASLLLAATCLVLVATGITVGATAAQPDSRSSSIAAAPLLTPTAAPTCAPSWQVVVAKEVQAEQGAQLSSADATSPSNVWAVGTYLAEGTSHRRSAPKTMPGMPSDKHLPDQGGLGIERTLIERWDGTAWSIVPSPNASDDDNELFQVSAISASDIWATGYYVSAIGVAQTLAEHWNGSAWQIVPTPDTTPLQDNELNSVEVVASNDVWAAGYASDDTGRQTTLIEHWNGTAWAIVASPNVGLDDNSLVDLSAISANDVWAVGTYFNDAGYNRNPHTLALHWDGSVWSVVPTSAVGNGYNTLISVSGAASNDVWAVGAFYSSGGGYRVLMEHWDGTIWNVIPPPLPSQVTANLTTIDALSTNDVWAIGSVSSPSSYSPQALSLHWDGSQWHIVRGVTTSDNTPRYLLGAVVVAPNDVWAVGTGTGNYPFGKTLAEHYSTACVTCSLRFTDVPESSPFFASIECLACQDIASGYLLIPSPPPPIPTGVGATRTPGTPGTQGPTSTPIPTSNPFISPTPYPTPPSEFRPNSNVSRAQLAKIVSNSAGYDEDPGQQMFQDIYPYSEFYPWVNRLARRGILNGYPCGGPGEPCGPDNLPYFRPNNHATRGQIAKIISNAAGYSEPHTEQSFADVPSNSTFYIYIARLYSRAIVGGYPCGHRGEPCLPPANLPYFRTNNVATRGQTSKMDAKALLPDCYVP